MNLPLFCCVINIFMYPCYIVLDGYSVNGGSGENAFGRKSLGQELRVNNVSPDFTVQHGNRALATKDMRKSQGKI